MPTKKKATKKTNLKKVVAKKTNWLMWGGVLGVLVLGGWMFKSVFMSKVGINEIGEPKMSSEVLASWNLRDASNFRMTNSKKVTVWQPFNYTTGFVKHESGAGIRLSNLGGTRGIKIFSVDTTQALKNMYNKIYSGDPIQSLRANVAYEVTLKPTWVVREVARTSWSNRTAYAPAPSATATPNPSYTPKPSDNPLPSATVAPSPMVTSVPMPSYTPKPSVTSAPVPTMKLPLTVEFYSGVNKDGKRQLVSKMTQDVVMPLNTSTKISFNFNDLDPYRVATLDLVRVYVSPSKETGWLTKYPQASVLIEEMSMNGVLMVSRSERVNMQGVVKQEQKDMYGYTQTMLYFEDQNLKKYMANFSWNILVPTSANYTNPYTYLNKTVWISGWASRWDWMNWVFNDGTSTNLNIEIDYISDSVPPTPSATPSATGVTVSSPVASGNVVISGSGSKIDMVSRYSYLAEPKLLENYEKLMPTGGVAVPDSSL